MALPIPVGGGRLPRVVGYRIERTLRPMLRALSDVALPQLCAGCGVGGASLCPDCRTALLPVQGTRWSPTPAPAGLPPAWTCLIYQGAVRSALVAWKDQDRVDLTGPLSRVLAGGLAAALAGDPCVRAGLRREVPVYVVPAPSARSGTRRRGRWPVQDLLARTLSGRAGCSCVEVLPALRMSRVVADQAGLGARERSTNLRGAMTVTTRHTDAVRRSVVVVVDDVVTSGATLAEAARALRAAGAADVLALTLAATPRRAGREQRGLDTAHVSGAV